MTQTVPAYRWSVDGFVRAWEADAFDSHVELVNGEIWPVIIGDWHGVVTFRLGPALQSSGVHITCSSLPSGESLLDPDWWVQRDGAEPVSAVGRKLSRWDPVDVLLVAEVSDETILADLTTKATLYGAAGYAEYWVVTPEAIFVHTEPSRQGYGNRRRYLPGAQIPVPYAGQLIDVAELIAS